MHTSNANWTLLKQVLNHSAGYYSCCLYTCLELKDPDGPYLRQVADLVLWRAQLELSNDRTLTVQQYSEAFDVLAHARFEVQSLASFKSKYSLSRSRSL